DLTHSAVAEPPLDQVLADRDLRGLAAEQLDQHPTFEQLAVDVAAIGQALLELVLPGIDGSIEPGLVELGLVALQSEALDLRDRAALAGSGGELPIFNVI